MHATSGSVRKPERSKRRCARATALAALCALAASPADADLYCPTPPEEGVAISADRMDVRPPDRVRLRDNAQVRFKQSRIRADLIDYNDKRKRLRAKGDVQYTNCLTKNPVWFLSADEIVGDLNKKEATIKNMRLFVGGVPVFSLPRWRLAFGDERESGFLIPIASYDSDSGARLGLPLYLNIAPNYDAELTPLYLSKRGAMAAGEFRALGRHSNGRLRAEGLNDNEYDEDDYRYLINARHTTDIGDFFRINGELSRVSDKDYLDDITPFYSSPIDGSYLRSHMDLDYASHGWRFNLLTETFQSANRLETSDRPYTRKPQASLSKIGRITRANINYRFDTHFAEFRRRKSEDDDELRSSKRVGARLTLEYPWEGAGFHLTPKVGIDHIYYNLPSREDETRTVPSYTLHGGIHRSKQIRGGRFIHTFEPEFAYIRRPERAQENLPLLDTKISDADLTQVREADYFNGPDRISDADQIGLMINTRLINAETGDLVARLGVGQIRHLSRPEVCLYYLDDGRCFFDRTDRPASDIMTELDLKLSDRALIRSALTWNDDTSSIEKSFVKLQFNDGDSRVANFTYRKRRRLTNSENSPQPIYTESIEQLGVGAGVTWANGWSAAANWDYDLRRGKYLEYLVGAQYRSCCWGLRLVFRRHLDDIDPGPEGGLALDDGVFDYDTLAAVELFIGGFESGTDSKDLLESRVEGFALP